MFISTTPGSFGTLSIVAARKATTKLAKKPATKTAARTEQPCAPGRGTLGQTLLGAAPGVFDDWIAQFDRFASLITSADRIAASDDDDDDEALSYDFTHDPRPLAERFDQLALFEMALQHYVCENPHDLGFADVRGPFPRGPDLHVKVKSRWVHAEVEVQAANYFKHGHHKDPNFAKVQILVVPEQGIPPSLRERLPKKIITIKRAPFVAWFEPRRLDRRFDRSSRRRRAILGGAYADLAHRIENASTMIVTCAPCGVRATFRVEEHEPGFRDPDDRVELRCPACKAVLATVKALDATLMKTIANAATIARPRE